MFPFSSVPSSICLFPLVSSVETCTSSASSHHCPFDILLQAAHRVLLVGVLLSHLLWLFLFGLSWGLSCLLLLLGHVLSCLLTLSQNVSRFLASARSSHLLRRTASSFSLRCVVVIFSQKLTGDATKNKCSDGSKAKSYQRARTCRGAGQIRWIPPSKKEVLEIGCKYGAEGIQDFLKGEARKMANELRMPIQEAEDCLNDLLEMEREELDPVREAKVTAACRDMVGQWDKEMRPVPQELVEEPAPDVQPDGEKRALPPDETCVTAEAAVVKVAGTTEEEPQDCELEEPAAEDDAQKSYSDLAEVAHHTGNDLVPLKLVGEFAPEAQPDVAEAYAPPLEEQHGRDIVDPAAEDGAQKDCPDLDVRADVDHHKGSDSVPQKFVDEPALDAQPDVVELHAPPPDETCVTAEAGDEFVEPSAEEDVQKACLNIVEEYVLWSALLHVAVALKRTWDISFDLCPPEYLVNIWRGITRLGFFWVKAPCKPVQVRDSHRWEFEVFASLGWVLFYIGAVCVFTTHVCLGWAKVVGAPALGILKRYQNKAAHIGYVMTIGMAFIHVFFPTYTHGRDG